MDLKFRSGFLAECLLESIEDENYLNFKILIKFQANPNTIISGRGIAPIHYAAGMENTTFSEAAMKLMLKNGGDPNVQTRDGETPLHVAAIWNRQFIIEILMDHGADLMVKDIEGKTAIDYAIEERHFNLIPLFQNYMFETKIEKRRLMELKSPTFFGKISPKKANQLSVAMDHLSVSKNPTEILTPNKTNFNFDNASPFYVNVTRRKPRRTISIDKDLVESPTNLSKFNEAIIVLSDDDGDNEDVIDVEENLFQLTQENLDKHLRSLPNRNRSSLVDTWRAKVSFIHRRQSILPSNTDLDSFLTSYLSANETSDEVTTESQTTIVPMNDARFIQSYEMTEDGTVDESFMTAIDERNNVPADDKTYVLQMPKLEESILQLEEAFVHRDPENNIVFYEHKQMPVNKSKATVAGSHADDDVMSCATSETEYTLPVDYDTDDLRNELKHFGEVPGPITQNTKKLYLKRLIKYKRKPPVKLVDQRNGRRIQNVSVELLKTLRDENSANFIDMVLKYSHLEREMVDGFITCPVKKFREGNLKTSFNYLLIDPRVSENLPAESAFLSKHEVWKRFVASIFYVGKGKSSRPYAHLYDAIKLYQDKKNAFDDMTKFRDSIKLERIIEIWKSGRGVVCLPVFHSIMPVEAYSREAAIIDSIGVENLTNIKRGDYYGIIKSWTMRQRKQLGVLLLYKAMNVFMAEGESQLKPNDIQSEKNP